MYTVCAINLVKKKKKISETPCSGGNFSDIVVMRVSAHTVVGVFRLNVELNPECVACTWEVRSEDQCAVWGSHCCNYEDYCTVPDAV
jgi:hypothetical protein